MNRNRRRPNQHDRKNRFGWLPILVMTVIIGIGIVAGYMGTKYVMHPLMESFKSNNEPQVNLESEIQQNEVIEESNQIRTNQDQTATKENSANNLEKITLYTLQFGTFTTKENADIFAKELSEKYIYSYSVKDENQYKLLSLPFTDKEKAKSFATGYQTMGSDCFVIERKAQDSDSYSPLMINSFIDMIYSISINAYTGTERINMVSSALDKLKAENADFKDTEKEIIDALTMEINQISGNDNNILLELQKNIIINIEKMLI